MFAKRDFLTKRINNLKIVGCLLQLAPFIRGVILTGSMTNGLASEKSDIDLLIISAPKRLYTARLFSTFWVEITGLRRRPTTKNPAGKFCLNYYLASDNLDICPHTARCARFHRHIIRVWDKDGTFERLWRENQWLRRFTVPIKNKKLVKQVENNFPIDRPVALSILRLPLEIILSGKLGDWVEERLRNWQIQKITHSRQYKKNKKGIVFSRSELRLHPKKRV